MTRWPHWKDSRKPGTYMLTLKVSDGEKLLGTLQGSTAAVYRWMKENNDTVASASHDPLYYRHALLGTKAMPFIQKPTQDAAAQSAVSSCDGVSTPSNKPSLWQPGYCLGVCNTEEKLHTRIGYVLENPFFGIMEKEQPLFMERTMLLSIADRRYRAYGNILLLKEPDRIQVFCHRQHPTTRQPYHLTDDFNLDKATALDAAANGTVIVTPAISPGELEIMWAVLRAGGNVINIQRELPLDDKWHPDKERRLYCQRGQLLVLAAHDLPEYEYRDRQGNVIPSDTRYSQFHNLNAIAAELCQEGVEHNCKIKAKR